MTKKETDKIILFEEKEKLDAKRAGFQHNRLLNNLVIGSELETQNTSRKKREKLFEKLKPNREYGCYNETGVHSIVGDGSLHTPHNVEVIYAGTNFSTEEMREQLHKIEMAMLSQNEYTAEGKLKEGFYTDTRTGQHISILQVKPYEMPEIILKNIYQITRIFCANIAYLTCTGVGTTPLRSSSIDYARVPNASAKGKTFKQLMSDVRNDTGSQKYSYVNIGKNIVSKTRKGIIDEMFFEIRVADRIMSATIEASLFQLMKAIALKSATISKKGLILAKNEFWEGQKEVYHALQNKKKEMVDKHIKKDLEEQTLAFLKYLKPEFDRFAPEAYTVLEYLTKKPLWNRKKTKDDKGGWEEIEKEFYKVMMGALNNDTQKNILGELETDDDFFNNENKEEVINKLSKKLKLVPATIEKNLKEMGYEWDNKLKLFEKI